MGLLFSKRHLGLFLGALATVAATNMSKAVPLQTRPGGVVAFAGVTVIDGTGAPARSGQTVVISGDRITEVGSSANVRVPRAARIIKAEGKFLIPGLWDAHVHTRYAGIDHFRLLVANGITSARNMSAPWEYLPEILRGRDQIANGDRIGPRVLTAGPVFDGPAPFRSTSVVINNPGEARQAVQRVKREGADFVKVYNLLSRESYFAIAAEAKAQGLPFVGHLPFPVSAEEASDAGQRSIEHMEVLSRTASDRAEEIRTKWQGWRPGTPPPIELGPMLIILRDSFNATKLRPLADRFKKNQTSVVPTLSVSWGRFERRSEHSIVAGAERLRYVPAAYAEAWKQVQAVNSEDFERRLFEQDLIGVREFHNAGVTILAGTDVGIPFQVPGFSLHDELSLLVKAGMSEMEVLEAATRNPARTFNLSDQGTIEAGMRADLVVLDANPLENIDNTRRIRTVVAAGRVFERNELDSMLAQVQKAASQWTGTPTR